MAIECPVYLLTWPLLIKWTLESSFLRDDLASATGDAGALPVAIRHAFRNRGWTPPVPPTSCYAPRVPIAPCVSYAVRWVFSAFCVSLVEGF